MRGQYQIPPTGQAIQKSVGAIATRRCRNIDGTFCRRISPRSTRNARRKTGREDVSRRQPDVPEMFRQHFGMATLRRGRIQHGRDGARPSGFCSVNVPSTTGCHPERSRGISERIVSRDKTKRLLHGLSRNDAVDRGERAARVLSSPTRRRPSGCVARNTVWFFQSVSPDVFGGTPNTAGQRPALPIPTESFRLRERATSSRHARTKLSEVYFFFAVLSRAATASQLTTFHHDVT